MTSPEDQISEDLDCSQVNDNGGKDTSSAGIYNLDTFRELYRFV